MFFLGADLRFGKGVRHGVWGVGTEVSELGSGAIGEQNPQESGDFVHIILQRRSVKERKQYFVNFSLSTAVGFIQ